MTTKERNYEVELRYAGPKAKAIRAAMKAFVEKATSAYIETHTQRDDAKRRAFSQEAIEFGMAIDNLMREHAMHVAWGSDPEEEVRRLAGNAQSPKVKKALEKLAEQLKGGTKTAVARGIRTPVNQEEDDGRFD